MEEKITHYIWTVIWLIIAIEYVIYFILYFTTRKKFDVLLAERGYMLPVNFFFYVPDPVGRVINYANLIVLGPTAKVLKSQFKGFDFKKHATRFDLTMCSIHLVILYSFALCGIGAGIFVLLKKYL